MLEAKYLDFCSARVAEVLLSLTPDEMYVLAQDALADSNGGQVSLSYEEMVRLATERISGKLPLPSFDEWRRAYREYPGTYEREMLGLWRSDVRVPPMDEGEGDPAP